MQKVRMATDLYEEKLSFVLKKTTCEFHAITKTNPLMFEQLIKPRRIKQRTVKRLRIDGLINRKRLICVHCYIRHLSVIVG